MFKKLIIPLTIIIALSSSCGKEYLDTAPETDLLDSVAFSTPARVLQQVNGMYAGVKTGSSFVGLQFYSGRFPVYQDIRGEEFLNRTANGVTNLQTWNFTVLPSTNEVQNLWGAIYQAINRCNIVLEGLDKAPISTTLANQYRGEAKFLRALCYYSLLTLYAPPHWDNNGDKPGVPLRLKAETKVNPASNQLPRAKVGVVYDTILKDLDFAEANLPLTYSTATLNVTRAHRNTATAFKTRVYLSMRKYDEVIKAAEKLIPSTPPYQAPTGVPHTLEPNIQNVFNTYTTAESIFSFPFTTADVPGTQNGLGHYYNPGPAGGGDYSLNPNGIVANTNWKSTDARRAFNQFTQVGTQSVLFLRKFPRSPHTDWLPVIRYAEVMLNLAEALARNNAGVDVRALALVNAVRQRSDPSTTLTALSQQELINVILTERRIELLGEGFRSIDILRLGQTLPAKGVAPAVGPNDPQYIWPIPQNELAVNKAVEQNRGY